MLAAETVRTEGEVAGDDCCKAQTPPATHPGPAGGRTTSAVVRLAISAHASRFPAERAVHRPARRRLRPRLPGVPGRDRCHRLVRAGGEALTAGARHVGHALATGDDRAVEAIDGTGLVVRHATRRGTGWVCGPADRGWGTRLGWDEGRRLLVSGTPSGVVTGGDAGPLPPPTGSSPRPAARPARRRRRGCPASAPRPATAPSPIGGSAARGARPVGRTRRARSSSARPRRTATAPGPSRCGPGWPAAAR